jgi:predicted NBD/HSP70 family sugar kinase
MAGLRSSTASYIVGRLREKGLIIEKPGQSTKRGAKPVLLSINPQGKYVVGVEINPGNIHIGLFNFDCELVQRIKAVVSQDRSPESVVDSLEINLRGLLGKNNVSSKDLFGVGVTLSGSIGKDGTVDLSSTLKWKNVKLLDMLQSRFDFPVSIHTTRVRLLAERSMKDNEWSQNIVYLNIANGVGIAAIIDGQLLHGTSNRSGELGHMIVNPNGPLCGCGHKGCLEAHISGPALTQKLLEEAPSRSSLLKNWLDPKDMPEETIQKWGDAIKQSDPYAIELQDYLCEYVGKAASLAINLYDPEIFILAGYVTQQCFDALKNAIQRKMVTDVYDNKSRSIKIVAAQAGDLALVRGVAMAVLQNIMQN